jgi:hypothetical protein
MGNKDNKEKESWHLSRTVNISHLATTVILVVGMVSYIGDIEKAVAVQQAEITNIKDKMSAQISSYDSLFERIDSKLDKLYELMTRKNK